MRKLILTACLLTLTAASADAGPLRTLLGRRGCGGCPPAAPVRCGPPVVTMPPPVTTPAVVQTSYSGVGVPVDPAAYTPIRVGTPLPTTCVNCPK